MFRSTHHSSDNLQTLFGKRPTLSEAYSICILIIKGADTCGEDSDSHIRESAFLSAAHYCLSDDEIAQFYEFSKQERFLFLRGLNITASKIWLYDIPALVRQYFQNFVFGPVSRKPDFQRNLGLGMDQCVMDL